MEDSAEVREAEREALEVLGYRALTAVGGQEAVEANEAVVVTPGG